MELILSIIFYVILIILIIHFISKLIRKIKLSKLIEGQTVQMLCGEKAKIICFTKDTVILKLSDGKKGEYIKEIIDLKETVKLNKRK